MLLTELHFECFRDTTIQAVELAISDVINALRYNGQIIGREFPCQMREGIFVTRVVCPEPDSLHPNNHSDAVNHSLDRLAGAGLLKPKVKIQGEDLHSDTTDPDHLPEWQLLYTSYLQCCSPVRCGDHFSPIPLYRLPATGNGDHQQVIKWQEDWQACDQLQMNGLTAEFAVLHELSSPQSSLVQRGRQLATQIEQNSGVATYYYLYRVGGESRHQEQHRPCPGCGGDWRLPQPLHAVIDFKCDDCRLVSNISWDYKD